MSAPVFGKNNIFSDKTNYIFLTHCPFPISPAVEEASKSFTKHQSFHLFIIYLFLLLCYFTSLFNIKWIYYYLDLTPDYHVLYKS